MIKKTIISLLTVILFITPALAQTYNAGFITGIWLSKTPIFVGQTVRIYTAVQNHSGFDIDGSVKFVIDGEDIDARGVSAVNDRIIEVWTDHIFDYGNHTIEARFIDPSIDSGSTVSLNNDLINLKIFVDTDTDGDEIGDVTDEDDDNDGVSDEDELARGTNPLIAESEEEDGTGLFTGEDIASNIEEATKFIEENVAPAIGSVIERVDPDGTITNRAISLIDQEKQNLFDIALERGTGLSPQERFRIFLLDVGAFIVNNWLWFVLGIFAIYILKRLARKRD
ncbi:MAG: hypothetical protein COT88_00910 [Candidatus Colwellbacteria bacterium CG10_big_fil_rev_8_21_14_0_10_41_28]|uniref:CARDB domain-containing protein n=1 Tax=Candidatus Colwellbacteria bacterium CG10_big_fil_rev_8_21_14_0_10_41_28 TaxID=1974539 RepID=A0A2H0VHL4_9BACT|nr:MAG: hypothetical protein COT88_00910 [Candidatus Colwellbacteria bacterium CG10_big_fil_rev_8_21_14_0_10_41_28]